MAKRGRVRGVLLGAWWAAAVLSVAAGPGSASAEPPEQPIVWLTHGADAECERQPDGTLRGRRNAGLRSFLVELVNALAEQVEGRRPKIRVVPFARGLRTVQSRSGYALFNVARAPEREGTVRWVGPTFETEVWLYKRRGAQPEIRTLDDARRVRRVCVQQGAGDEVLLRKLGFRNLDPVRSSGHALKMVALGRADLAPVGEIVFDALVREFRIDPDALERTPVRIFHSVGYIAFSPDTDPETIARWQAALDALKRSERYEQLVRDYLTPAR